MSTSTPTIAATTYQTAVAEMYASFNRGDVPAILATLSPDIEWIANGPQAVIPYCGTRRGIAGATDFFTLVNATEEYQEFTPDQYVAAGDLVAVRGHCRVTVRATGKKYGTAWLHLFTFRNGECVRVELCYDSALVAAAHTK